MHKVPRIAIITSIHPDFDPRIWKHCNSLVNEGCHVLLICPWDVPNGTIKNGIQIYTFQRINNRLLRVINPILILKQLLPLIKNIDLIHFHDIDLLPLMALIKFCKPVVYDVHENYPDEIVDRYWIPDLIRLPLSHLVSWGQYLLSKIIRNIVLVAPSQLKYFNNPKFNIFYLKNYASASLLEKVNGDYFKRPDTIVFTGSGYESNGIFLLLEIASLVMVKKPNAKFLVTDRFASPKIREAFLFEREKKKLVDKVKILPYIPSHEIMTVLNQATIAIAPNLRVLKQEKAIPTKLFEYMAAALPIVSSDLPYQKELIDKYQAGILAQPEDPGSFADAIIGLIDDRRFAYEMGQNGQKAFIAHFCWETQIPGLINYYDLILSKMSF